MTLCCRLKTHLQGLPACRVSFTGETLSSWFVWVFYYYLEKRKKTSSLQCSWDSWSSGTFWTFSHWTNSLRRETWRAKPFLCRMTDYSHFPSFSRMSCSQAELEGQVCRISQRVKRFKGAVSVLWLNSSCCCSVSAHAAPIGMFVLIALLWLCAGWELTSQGSFQS